MSVYQPKYSIYAAVLRIASFSVVHTVSMQRQLVLGIQRLLLLLHYRISLLVVVQMHALLRLSGLKLILL